MNPFKINQNLTFNIFAFSGYLIALLNIIVYGYAQISFILLYIGFVILFAYYYIFYFLPVLFVMFLAEIIFRRKLVWHFSDEYKHNKLALGYFGLGILLNIIIYFVMYKVFILASYLT